ncbi:MAG: NnrU family protein, partial [Polynucleobacter sp.]|nr:NnrU family protein [Polynucleobacter sp.]
MSFLILGLAIFLGVHSLRLFAADWRDAQCARLGEARWKGVYSLISLVGLGLIIWGYGMARVDAPVLWPSPSWT